MVHRGGVLRYIFGWMLECGAMTPDSIETLGVKSYYKGLQDCLMLIQSGLGKGLSLQDSYDSAKKAIEKTEKENNVNHQS